MCGPHLWIKFRVMNKYLIWVKLYLYIDLGNLDSTKDDYLQFIWVSIIYCYDFNLPAFRTLILIYLITFIWNIKFTVQILNPVLLMSLSSFSWRDLRRQLLNRILKAYSEINLLLINNQMDSVTKKTGFFLDY